MVVPDYPENDRTELFNEWINGPEKAQKAYQKLFNTSEFAGSASFTRNSPK